MGLRVSPVFNLSAWCHAWSVWEWRLTKVIRYINAEMADKGTQNKRIPEIFCALVSVNQTNSSTSISLCFAVLMRSRAGAKFPRACLSFYLFFVVVIFKTYWFSFASHFVKGIMTRYQPYLSAVVWVKHNSLLNWHKLQLWRLQSSHGHISNL